MKSIYSFKVVLLLLVMCLFTASCTHEHEEGDGHTHEGETDQHTHTATEGEAHHAEGIFLTKEQIATVEITFGDFSEIKINDFIKATGTLGLPPNALTSVSAKTSGFIKNSNKYIEGSYVKKGVIMAYLETPEFIQHQREYLEVAADLVFAEQELARQQALVDASAGVEKNLQRLQAEVQRKTATRSGIARQLSYLGINVKELSAENIVQQVPIYSPMSGYITSINMHNGMYVSPDMELMEIVDEGHLHLELDVFEKDIVNVKRSQPISYTVPALGTSIYKGEVSIIGKEFNRTNKTVRVHGHLDQERPKFIKDFFVEAKIWLNDQLVQALPEKAIIKDGAFSYIYVSDGLAEGENVKFVRIRVITGASDKQFTTVELLDQIPAGMKIVTDGAYYVYAQSMAGELEHSH